MSATGAPDTIVCSTCWTVLATESHFCSACGAQVSSTSTGAMRLPALLSEANLYRMRARWLDAENRCIEALRLDPNNVDGHSLLGDIYRDQGKLSEAAQWYHLALDLNPGSMGDRAKLAEVEKQRNQKVVVDLGVIKPAPPSHYGTQKLMGLPPTTWLQGITVVAVAFVIIVIGIAISIRGRSPETGTLTGPRQAGSAGSPVPGSSAPPSETANKGVTGLLSAASPSPVLPNLGRATGDVPVNLNQPSESDLPIANVPDEKPTVVRLAPTGATEYEKNLRSFIAGHARLGRSVLGSITVDPRHPRAIVILSLNPHSAEVSSVRTAALKLSVNVAAAALSGDSALTTITVNVRLKSGADRYLPVFAGDAEGAAINSLPENARFEQLLAAFSSYWWEPKYAPPGLPAFTTQPPAP